MNDTHRKPDGSTNLTDAQKEETADVGESEPDTASGGSAEPPDDDQS